MQIPFDEVKNGWPHKGESMGVERIGYPNLALWPVAFWGSIAFVVVSIIKREDRKTALFVAAGICIDVRTVFVYPCF